MGRSRYEILEPGYPHFLTCTVHNWVPVFSRPAAAQLVIDSWKFLIEQRRIVLFGWVLMENHVHWVAQADDLGNQIHDFKAFTAKKILDRLRLDDEASVLRRLGSGSIARRGDRTHQFWEEGSHPQALISDAMMPQKLEYIHDNPIKRGYVDQPQHWRYSSARDYAGESGLIPVTTSW